MARRTEDVVWDAVVNQLEVDPSYDHDGAVRLADEAKQLMERGRRYDIEERRAARRERWWRRFGWTAATVVVLFGLLNIPYWLIRVHANDYAHVDPGSVGDGAYYGIQRWYGQNDLPRNLSLASKTHSQYAGHSAWLTRWHTSSGKDVCVYVWGDGAPATPHGTTARVAGCP